MTARKLWISLSLFLAACSFAPIDPETELARHQGQAGQYAQSLEKRMERAPEDPEPHYKMAWVLERQGQLEEALKHAERAVALAPLAPRYRLLLGRLYQRLGDHFQAANLLSSALQLDDRLLEGYYYLALSLEETGQPEEALSQLNLALEIEPLYFDARLAWVRISATTPQTSQDAQAQAEQRNELIAKLEAALKIKPKSVEGALLLAQLYRDQGAGFRARLILEDWLQRFGENDRIIAELASVYAAQGEESRALELLKSQEAPGPEARALRLRILRGKEAPDRLIQQLQAELEKTPQNISLHLLEGELYLEMGQIDRAERSFQRVLKFDPKNAQAYIYLAQTYVEQADYAGEQLALEKARELAPGSLQVRLAWLESLVRRGLWKQAEDQIAQTSLSQESRRLMLLKGYLAQMRGDYARAEDLIRRARKQGSDPQSDLALARLEIARGLVDTGIDRIKELLKQHPRHFEAQLVLAKGYLRQGQHTKLEGLLAPLLDRQRGEGRAHLLLARSRIDRGQFAQAANLLSQGLKTWPRQPDLAQLYTATLGVLGRYRQAIPLLEEMQRFDHRYSDLFAFRLWEFYLKAGQTAAARQHRLPSER